MEKIACRHIVFAITCILAIVALIPLFCHRDCLFWLSPVISAISIFIGGWANFKSDRNAKKLDEAFKVERGKKGEVISATIDGGEF